jgi:hypothetical protein
MLEVPSKILTDTDILFLEEVSDSLNLELGVTDIDGYKRQGVVINLFDENISVIIQLEQLSNGKWMFFRSGYEYSRGTLEEVFESALSNIQISFNQQKEDR